MTKHAVYSIGASIRMLEIQLVHLGFWGPEELAPVVLGHSAVVDLVTALDVEVLEGLVVNKEGVLETRHVANVITLRIVYQAAPALQRLH